MAPKITTLGGTASNVKIGKVAHGLMMMTWSPNPISDEEAFECIKAGIDILPEGTKMFINSGEFYGSNPPEANLELISRFFEKYPSYTDKTFLSVKGGVNIAIREPDSSEEGLRRSVDNINAKLRGKKKMDLFECARVDKNFPIENTVTILEKLVKEGKFDHIGLSECAAETLRRANKVYPIAAVEIEVSPWSYCEKTQAVIAAAEELGVAVIAYSPLGRGFLTGQIKSAADLPENDMRRRFARFNEENIKHNIGIVDGLKAIADKKGVTAAQLCIAWVSSRGARVVPLHGSRNKNRSLENFKGGDVELSDAELAGISDVLAKNPVQGGRYYDGPDEAFHLFG